MNDFDLDSVTLKAYKVKDCGRHLGSDDCIWVGFTRTGNLPVSRHKIKNFAGPLWPNLIC